MYVKRRRAVTVLLALFTASRVVLFWVDREVYLEKFPYQDDAPGYWQLARVWAGQGTYEQFGLSPFTRVPLYPLFLIPFLAPGGSLHLPALFLVQQLMLLAVILGVFWYVYHRHGIRVGMTVAVTLTLFFDVTLYGFLVRSEALFTFLLFGAAAVLIQYWRRRQPVMLAGSGALFGLVALTRPVAFLVFIPALPVIWAAARREKTPLRRSVIFAGLFLTAFAAVLSPWLVRNWRLTGTFLLQQDTSNLIYATYPGGHWQAFPVDQMFDATGKDALTVDRALTALAVQRIAAHPSIWVRNSLHNFLFRLWAMGFTDTYLRYFDYASDRGAYQKTSEGLLNRWAASLQLGSKQFSISPLHHLYLIANNVLGFSLIFMVLLSLIAWPLLSTEGKIIESVLVYFWAITSVFAFSGSRYMVPLVPLLFMLLPDMFSRLRVRRLMG
ncbi:MAG: hypothetical protein COT71_02530 [Candidatus Andersenbacteria bacterium CG10_big_fil_rev_8_21_14_0_10_54_11]|uniref:Uncharacterized protein n=1 Tax=Candidatus Andersenbacteria bacterium CG10_big_fil_rev_8_21_14_0_10_54_11 TaxID=1974485 RepID=A0A2M6WZC6_9BACT|nr:MAG: hypothetical protein COT71_02530 [Candidatus Andersenbacteria bacterium CG10_big_fil_rev_8_21_14_0_10_54_11]